ncbi:hypothetical protein HPHPM2_0895 [Helicobacter pylori Hp M2]|nr:hypothetical protein HPHPH24C_0809 [Helicobacter pylori Hp H-24c]EJC41751.1 hypothetical protein HPHPM2_0895 [Helicobacter pylori Hp M2]EJC46529.1 hypothetical protein HPHPM5_1061 [Helicobacter pylori Hp M5]
MVECQNLLSSCGKNLEQGIGNEKEFGFLPISFAWISGFRR